MANEQNLKPIKKGELTKEEAKKRGSNGGKKSVEVRRQKKMFRELVEELLNEEGGTLNGRPATRKEMMIARAWEIISDKEVDPRLFFKGFELIRDTCGELPTQNIQMGK